MANEIKCPKCGETINIENLIKTGAKEALDKEIQAKEKEFEQKLEEYKKLSKKEIETAVESAIEEQKKEFKQKEEKIKTSALEEQKEALDLMTKELEKKSQELREMNKLKIENLKLEREKEELREEVSLEAQKQFEQKLIEEKQKLQKSAESKYELQIEELKKQLEDQKLLTQEMQKRQEQGSMQLQGEVQELAIEKYLAQNFIFDTIQEVKKGDMGADTIQVINTPQSQNVGSIYYESKRTKTFKDEWISKFKSDIQSKGASIGVLVTAVYPKGMDRMGIKDGIYICTYEEFKALSFILRENILRISEVEKLQENRHEKSAILYNYLTSTEFRFQFETIVNSFVEMQKDLDTEKRAMNKIWKKREKEILNVIGATSDMYGAIQGIAGNAIKPVEALEMPLLSEISQE